MSIYSKIIDRQKLKEAWMHVKHNKPAAGVDGVTYEEFDRGFRENLSQLYTELEEHTYESLPVKLVPLYKGEKKREVSLYSMRDKVVQQAVAAELLKFYDKKISDHVYAYHPGRSALKAVNFLSEEMKKPTSQWILKTDISDFFERIVLEKLYHMLFMRIREQDVIDLIKKCCEASELQNDGSLRAKTIGLYQGSGIAPILSNIYLMEYDYELGKRCEIYVRYSDDMIVLGDSIERLNEIKNFMKIKLGMLGLSLNEEKTVLCAIEEGVEFLGYQLSRQGKEIPVKSETCLQERLEKLWLESGSGEEKLRKGAEILQGWEQYYRNERDWQYRRICNSSIYDEKQRQKNF